MANYKSEQDFISNVVPSSLLDDAISWIQSNMSPDDVFNKSQLEEWAEDNKYVKETD